MNLKISYNQAFTIISQWLERVANRDPSLFKNMMKQLHSRYDIIKQKIELDDI